MPVIIMINNVTEVMYNDKKARASQQNIEKGTKILKRHLSIILKMKCLLMDFVGNRNASTQMT